MKLLPSTLLMFGCRSALYLQLMLGIVVVGSGVSQEQVRLIDDQTFEMVDVLPLHRYEMACSCTSLTLADDPNPYYVVGTAFAIPDEQEPTQVHLCGYIVLPDP